MNTVCLVGNVGKDPDVKAVNDTTVANFTLATRETKDHIEWHRITAWGKQAEVAQKYIHKGSRIGVTGRLQTRSWDDKDGTKRYVTEIIANRVELLNSKGEETNAAPTQAKPFDPNDVDIPF